jgi:flavin-binding protein dodecin
VQRALGLPTAMRACRPSVRRAASVLAHLSGAPRLPQRNIVTIHDVFERQGICKEDDMAVARVTEISATSPDSFDAAVKVGLERANQTLRNVEGCWIKDMNVQVADGAIKGYRVNMEVTFVLDD